VTLALKTYALKSNCTGRTLLKGKGIPAWMIKESGKDRSKWNKNKA
jgi:hypothetical protein